MFCYKGHTHESKIMPLVEGAFMVQGKRALVTVEKLSTAKDSVILFLSLVQKSRNTPHLSMFGVGAVIRDAQTNQRISTGRCDLWYFASDPTHVFAVESDKAVSIGQSRVGEMEFPVLPADTQLHFHFREL
jgi:hypothetical protein